MQVPPEMGGFMGKALLLDKCVAEGRTIEETSVKMKAAISVWKRNAKLKGIKIPDKK